MMTLQSHNKTNKFPTPYWVLVEFKKGHSITGRIAGKEYRFIKAEQKFYKKQHGSWVELTNDEQVQRHHIVKTLRDQYAAECESVSNVVRVNKRKAHSLDATRQANQRGIGA